MPFSKRSDPSLPLIAAATVILPVIIYFPILLFGVPGQHPDQDHHFRLIRTYEENLRAFDLTPALSTAGNNGYGSYDVRVYPPLFHIVAAAAVIVTGSWQAGLFAAFAFFGMFGMIGVYLFSRELGSSPSGSLFGAIAFGITPYWVNHAYNSFFYGEIAAISVMPWCFLFAYRLCRAAKLSDIAGLSICFAALIISNLPQLVIGSISLAIFVLFHLEKLKFFRQIVPLAGCLLLAATLSSFYLVRVVVESRWFKISLPNTDPSYDPRNNFALGFLTSQYSVDSGWFAAILLGLAIGSVGIALVASGRIRKIAGSKENRSLLVLLMIAAILMVPISELLWLFGPLQKIQFPWRFLSIAAICGSVLLARCFDEAALGSATSRRPRLIVFAGLILVVATFSVKQLILAADYNSSEPPNASLARVDSSIGLEHWQPVWTEPTLFVNPTEAPIVQRTADPSRLMIETGPDTTTDLILPVAYYPYWTSDLNTSVSVGEKGALTLNNVPRDSRIELRFVEPAINKFAGYLSLITSLLLLSTFLAMLVRSVGSYRFKWTK